MLTKKELHKTEMDLIFKLDDYDYYLKQNLFTNQHKHIKTESIKNAIIDHFTNLYTKLN